MKVIISQPRYLPAVNFLQRLHFADMFVFLDNVQRQARGWENRNKILITCKSKWLTIPIYSSSRELIVNSRISGKKWVKDHQNIIWNAYRRHPYYDGSIVELFYEGIEEVLERQDFRFAETLIHLVLNACQIFGFKPKFTRSSSYPLTNEITGPEKLVKICKVIGASVYISGPNGKEYGIIKAFEHSGIEVFFHDYQYPVYKQFGQDDFVSWLCFFDPLFNLGVEKVKEWVCEQPKLSR